MTTDHDRPDPAAGLVDPAGQPMRRPGDRRCPRCNALPAVRVASAGFGRPHDVCGACGYEFAEFTITVQP